MFGPKTDLIKHSFGIKENNEAEFKYEYKLNEYSSEKSKCNNNEDNIMDYTSSFRPISKANLRYESESKNEFYSSLQDKEKKDEPENANVFKEQKKESNEFDYVSSFTNLHREYDYGNIIEEENKKDNMVENYQTNIQNPLEQMNEMSNIEGDK